MKSWVILKLKIACNKRKSTNVKSNLLRSSLPRNLWKSELLSLNVKKRKLAANSPLLLKMGTLTRAMFLSWILRDKWAIKMEMLLNLTQAVKMVTIRKKWKNIMSNNLFNMLLLKICWIKIIILMKKRKKNLKSKWDNQRI